MCWKSANVKDNTIIKRFISDSAILEIDAAIKLKTAEIRKTSKIKLPDAIIAATAVVYSMTLVTRNSSDFAGIKNLMLLNPYS
jgi:predicted nucleic acid-binding protein